MMNLTYLKFEKGDRVFYAGSDSPYIPQDFGTVKSIGENNAWVKWDSDEDTLWIESSLIVPIERLNNSQSCSDDQDELTVEKCIEFLSSKGYSVTLTRK